MSAPFDSLSPEAWSALAAHVGRLKHDLGKYVALQQRWLPADAPSADRRAALRDDLLSTRRGPSGIQDALSVWQEFRPGLRGEVELPGGHRVDLSAHPVVRAVEEGMGVLAEVVAALRAGDVSDEQVLRGGEAAVAVSDGCRALERLVRANAGAAASATPSGRG